MHKGLSSPHILLASNNPKRLIENLKGVLDVSEIAKIEREVDENVLKLFRLGEAHLTFATSLKPTEWRQKVSRLYYAAYNAKRAVSLKHDGQFSTDTSDHQKVDQLPETFPNQATYATRLRNLRDDRNLADYSHLAVESDLLNAVADAEQLVIGFLMDARAFLRTKGINI